MGRRLSGHSRRPCLPTLPEPVWTSGPPGDLFQELSSGHHGCGELGWELPWLLEARLGWKPLGKPLGALAPSSFPVGTPNLTSSSSVPITVWPFPLKAIHKCHIPCDFFYCWEMFLQINLLSKGKPRQGLWSGA